MMRTNTQTAAQPGLVRTRSFAAALKVLATAVALSAAPSVAWAVGVSANDGYGDQHVTSGRNNGWVGAGRLQSTSGKPVCFNGLVIFDGYIDAGCGRYTDNTRSTDYVSRGGVCDIGSWPGAADGAKMRVCTT